jgi:hypothetical protein
LVELWVQFSCLVDTLLFRLYLLSWLPSSSPSLSSGTPRCDVFLFLQILVQSCFWTLEAIQVFAPSRVPTVTSSKITKSLLHSMYHNLAQLFRHFSLSPQLPSVLPHGSRSPVCFLHTRCTSSTC